MNIFFTLCFLREGELNYVKCHVIRRLPPPKRKSEQKVCAQQKAKQGEISTHMQHLSLHCQNAFVWACSVIVECLLWPLRQMWPKCCHTHHASVCVCVCVCIQALNKICIFSVSADTSMHKVICFYHMISKVLAIFCHFPGKAGEFV